MGEGELNDEADDEGNARRPVRYGETETRARVSKRAARGCRVRRAASQAATLAKRSVPSFVIRNS